MVILLIIIATSLLTYHTRNTSPSVNQPPVLNTTASGWLHTSGTTILDSSNKQVVLRGIDDAVDSPRHKPTADEFSNIAHWGFNTVRLAISWDKLQPTPPTNTDPQWSTSYVNEIDTAVALASQNHLNVILDMHQARWSAKFGGGGFPNWLYPNEASCDRHATCKAANVAHCEFLANQAEAGVAVRPQDGMIAAWQFITDRYKHNQAVVGADLFNEPQLCTQANGTPNYSAAGIQTPLDNFYTAATQSVHAINPNILVIYEDNAYESYLTHSFALTRALNAPNVVYSTHFYPDSWSNGNGTMSCKPVTTVSGEAVLKAHVSHADSWNQPLYIGEFDGFHLSNQPKCPYYSSPQQASTDALSLVSYMKAHNVNWTFWEYADNQTMLNKDGSAMQPLLTDLQTGL